MTTTDVDVTDPATKTWQRELRSQFPIFDAHPRVAYLDSAATAQKPAFVIDAVRNQLTTTNANAGRGTYSWANDTTRHLEHVRAQIRTFLDDTSLDSSVHFVSGATEGIRSVAFDAIASMLRDGDQIMCPANDHHANADSWNELVAHLDARGTHVTITPLAYDCDGEYDFAAIAQLATSRLRFVAMTHIHHVYGMDMDIAAMRATVGDEVSICLDAAQSVGHKKLNVTDFDVDFVVFSGHKAMALTGTGVVWARNTRCKRFDVSGSRGTPNITGITSLGAALEWIDKVGIGAIDDYIGALTTYAVEALVRLDDIELLGCKGRCRSSRHGIVAFRHATLSSGDLGFILGAHDIFVRSDNHCQAGTTADDSSVRASFHIYSTPAEVDRLVEVVGNT